MMTNVKCVKKLILVITSFLLINVIDGQGVPQSPCPSVFQYQNEGGEWIGVVVITGLRLGQAIRININLSLRENLPNNFPGTLELYYPREQTLQNIIANKPVVYKIRFPVQNVLPKVVQILINDQLICAGQSEYGPLVSEIRLEHTLQTQLTGQQLAVDNIPPSYQLVQENAPSRPSSSNGIFGQGDRNYFFDDFINSRGPWLNVYPVSDSSKQQVPQSQPQGQPEAPQVFDERQQYPEVPQQQFTQRPAELITKRPKDTRPPPVRRKPSSSSLQRPRPSDLQPDIGSDSPVASGDNLSEVNRICGTVDPKFNVRPLVVGGEEIKRGTWPWLVAVYLNLPTSLSFQCGGSLISKRLVLTSAHCFYGNKRYTAQDVVLFLGRYNIRNWNETGAVADTADGLYIHPDYTPNKLSFDADIALVLMKNEVRFTSLIRPACLWPQPSTTDDIVGSRGIVVGWGRNEAGLKITSVPKKVEITVVSDLQCIRSNDQFRVLTSNRTFCAGDRDGNGPCTGDSGGGFMLYRNNRWYLRGTVSASLSDTNKSICNLDEYVIYVDVSKFLEWIRSYMIL